MSERGVVLELICAGCGFYWDMTQGSVDMDTRELGDGTVCVGCPECKSDIAVVSWRAGA